MGWGWGGGHDCWGYPRVIFFLFYFILLKSVAFLLLEFNLLDHLLLNAKINLTELLVKPSESIAIS